MCGIVGYVGERDALPILMDGLRRLEYRGYDSSGIALRDDAGVLQVRKRKGKLAALAADLEADPPAGPLGIGHTRWATHGAPSRRNAHPHPDVARRIAVVHNGIIENHHALRDELVAEGVTLASETDTELVAQLLGAAYARRVGALLPAGAGALAAPPAPEAARQAFVAALREALARLEGSFALAAICADAPRTILAARQFSPLVVGLGESETFLASDIPALLPHTRRVLVLEDGELAVLEPDLVRIEDLHGRGVERAPLEVTWDAEAAEKGGYDTYVRKEIHEQPRALADTLRGRIERGEIDLPELDALPLDGVRRAYIVAAGTSFYAGLYGKALCERWARLPTEVAIASEFRYADPILGPDSLVVLISQSGETADTLAAQRLAAEAGAPTLALTNVVGSSLARAADATLYLQVGPEIGVVATKTFTGQLVLLALLAAGLGGRRGALSARERAAIVEDLAGVPALIALALEADPEIERVARALAGASSMFFIGRGFGHIVALEGALKLKEISYVHAEGYPAGELKHGPIAMLDEDLPVFAIATASPTYDKLRSNVSEIRARSAPVVALVTEGDRGLDDEARHVLSVPDVRDELSPLVAVVPLQLFSYHVARERGCDIDQPRNLAKSVTVE